jgi:hypothetical protein
MSQQVVLSVYVKWAAESDPVAALPAALQAALQGLAAGEVTHEAACAVASEYLVANFLVENLTGGDELFVDAEEVWATATEVNKLRFVAGKPLPLVTAAAEFHLTSTAAFPADEEAVAAWTDEHGGFSDAVSFFWRFGDTDILLGEYEESGASVTR